MVICKPPPKRLIYTRPLQYSTQEQCQLPAANHRSRLLTLKAQAAQIQLLRPSLPMCQSHMPVNSPSTTPIARVRAHPLPPLQLSIQSCQRKLQNPLRQIEATCSCGVLLNADDPYSLYWFGFPQKWKRSWSTPHPRLIPLPA